MKTIYKIIIEFNYVFKIITDSIYAIKFMKEIYERIISKQFMSEIYIYI